MRHRSSRARAAILAVLAATAAAAAASLAPALAQGQSGTTLTAAVDSLKVDQTKTFQWTLDKSASTDTLNMFRGDTGTVDYTVKASKDQGTLAGSAAGQVCVTNGGSVDTANLQITANVTMPPSDSVVASGNVDVSGHPVIAAGDHQCYPFTIDIPVAAIAGGKSYKLTADVRITNHSGHLDTPFGPSPSATAAMPDTPSLVHDSLDVSDSNGEKWTFGDSGQQGYKRNYTCDGDGGAHKNTLTSTYGTGGAAGPSADATVTVNCYALDVSKTVNTSFTRTWTWGIDKKAGVSSLTLAIGEVKPVTYTVKVDATSKDSEFKAAGVITIHNPAPVAAKINSVSDAVGGTKADISGCQDASFPYDLPADGTLTCNYSVSLPDSNSGTNTATVTLQNTPSGTTEFTGTQPVDFGKATISEQAKTAMISDTFGGPYDPPGSGPGFPLTLTAPADVPKTFSYTRDAGPYGAPGSYELDDTAAFAASDNTSGSSSAKVTITVPASGCTLTIGYWKTHAGGVGRNPDMVTKLLPIWLGTAGGAKSVQVASAGQAIGLLSFSGDASNGINKLYAQLLGAKLNIANGADGAAVASVISSADAFLATRNASSWAGLTKKDQSTVLGWMTALDNFNGGSTGPGHCNE